MSDWLAGAGGLILLLAGVVLAVTLDAPAGPAGWRRSGPPRSVLLVVTGVVLALAAAASWLRLHP